METFPKFSDVRESLMDVELTPVPPYLQSSAQKMHQAGQKEYL